jgi:hypothetical protein
MHLKTCENDDKIGIMSLFFHFWNIWRSKSCSEMKRVDYCGSPLRYMDYFVAFCSSKILLLIDCMYLSVLFKYPCNSESEP